MPRHKIELTQPRKRLLHSDLELSIFSNGQKLGTLTISKGSIDWFPKRARRGTRIRWEAFAKLMDDYASR